MINRLDDLKESTTERVAELANIDLRSRADSAIEKWMAKYGAELVDFDGDGGTIRFDTLMQWRTSSFSVPELEEVLQEGMESWQFVGRDWKVFADLRVDVDLIHSNDKRGKRIGDLITT